MTRRPAHHLTAIKITYHTSGDTRGIDQFNTLAAAPVEHLKVFAQAAQECVYQSILA
jgi:hypothetical protein